MPDPTPLQIQLHNELYKEASEILWPYLPLVDGLTPGKPVDLQDIERGRRLLTRVLEMDPDNWSALWLLGLSNRVSGRLDEAYDALRRAYAVKPDRVDVGRELVLQCCMNGRGAEAVQVSRAVLALRPNDAGLLSNHALAQILAGDVAGARYTADRALALSPENRPAQGVRQLADDIAAGRAQRPQRWPWDDAQA